jgi:alpha-glucosidase
VAEASRNALGMRYQLLPYLYTLFYKANQKGDTVARPLWMNFPADSVASTIEEQFMLGSAIMVSPVVNAGANFVQAYFPQQTWYSFSERTLSVDSSSAGVWKSLSAPLTTVNVHVSGGNIVPLQQKALTTVEARKTPFTLLTAICPNGKAWGSLFWDDGEQVELNNYLTVNYEASASGSTGSFISTVENNSYADAANSSVQDIVVMAKNLMKPSAAALNGVDLTADQIVWDEAAATITFTNLGLKLNTPINLQWN